MKLGMIGLGDIAQKAYLPVLCSRADVELHLYTRDQEKLARIGQQYRYRHLHQSFESLLNSGIKGAFVHVATEAHYELVEQLLQHDIHVYVDKPITDSYDTTKMLVELAESKGLTLMTGFNRRYAPAYQKLKEVQEPNMVIMQKNRLALPAAVRTFIFDDFIHVVDTLRYLFPYPVEQLIVSGRIEQELLHHVTVQFISTGGATAIGIMNRDSGTNEEKVEVMSASEKRVAYNVSDVVVHQGKDVTKLGSNDWEPTLHKRGFENIVNDFIQAVATGTPPGITANDALTTHEICERIVAELTKSE
ncbi:gfo/Idh/MocA family oxidoreductase [Pontibacter diazotrophicus]|uniref:Gfo/Idh/MocA family oxidoreductase n=1 Tax=Pontibacter diazotrophicus TaxID=1400979 RepID=A0A3D8LHZ9_9BACT|nr:gfo/Idh/MocA family oxidoreductase [Pontibacter diazotrophicus]